MLAIGGRLRQQTAGLAGGVGYAQSLHRVLAVWLVGIFGTADLIAGVQAASDGRRRNDRDLPTYLPRLARRSGITAWAEQGAGVQRRDADERGCVLQAGRARATRFSAGAAIEGWLPIYRQVLERELPAFPGNAVHDRQRLA